MPKVDDYSFSRNSRQLKPVVSALFSHPISACFFPFLTSHT